MTIQLFARFAIGPEPTQNAKPTKKTKRSKRKEATITFDQTYANEEGEAGDQVDHTEVRVQADGETVCFTLPSGAKWECDQEVLRALLD